jgi:hypothetical protein
MYDFVFYCFWNNRKLVSATPSTAQVAQLVNHAQLKKACSFGIL